MNVRMVPLNLIIEDTEQPRNRFDQDSINELAENIKQIGLLNPIKVLILSNGQYKLIFGNRRYLACKKIGLSEIPCIISDRQDDLEIFLEQLAENIQREGFAPVEEAMAFQRLITNEQFNVSKKLLSSRLGKSETYISKKLDLLIFGQRVREMIHGGKEISQGTLTEEQVLKLKKLPIEYRDVVALKVAQESINVNDVAKIAELFTDSNISQGTKEKLASLPADHLLNVYLEHKIGLSRVATKNEIIPGIALADKDKLSNQSSEELIEDYIIKFSPLQEKVNELNIKIPSYYPVGKEILLGIETMSLDAREELQSSVDILTSTLEAYLKEWRNVSALIKENTGLKLIK